MKKVLFVSKSESIGGLEKVMAELTSSLDRAKYEITVMTGTYNPDLAKQLPEHVTYKPLFRSKRKGLDRLLIHLPPAVLHSLFIGPRYDVEISFQEGYPTRLVSGAGHRTKTVCWLHNDPAYFDFNLPYYRKKRKLAKALGDYDEVVAVSETIRKSYQGYLHIPGLKVIHNPVDLKSIKRMSLERVNDQPPERGSFRICYAGRLSEEKRVNMLLECVITLRRRGMDVQLIVVGDGEQLGELERRVRDEQAQEYIHLMGFKVNPYPYIAHSSLLVCCSQTESFGVAVAEALALGVPVLSTKCGGPEEMIEDGHNGLLVDNDHTGLLRGLETMVTNAEMYEQIRSKAALDGNRFGKAAIMRQIESILDR